MDFLWCHRFALRSEPAVDPNLEATETPEAPKAAPAEIRQDPLSWLARTDGYSDSERWWNDRVEERGDPIGLFAAVLETTCSDIHWHRHCSSLSVV
jgi:Family of unknown function (DUF5682)